MRRSRRVDVVRPGEEPESLAAIDVGAEVDAPNGTSPPQRRLSRSGFIAGAIALSVATALVVTLVVVTHGDRTHSGSTPTAGSRSGVVSGLGQCPSDDSPFGASGMNAGVRDLAGKLVPISASNVLICRYAPDAKLERVAVLQPAAAARLEADTNRLPTSNRLAYLSCLPARESFRLTFANDRQRVLLQESCGGIVNGAGWARPTAEWLDELAHYPSSPAPPSEFCCQSP